MTDLKRIILEIGTGNDLYGEDYTKAANRAVQDAIHHSSIIMFRSLGLDPAQMIVNVTIGVEKPELVDCVAVAKTLPRGQAHVTATHGGMNVVDAENGTTSVIAVASVEALYPIDPADWKVSTDGRSD